MIITVILKLFGSLLALIAHRAVSHRQTVGAGKGVSCLMLLCYLALVARNNNILRLVIFYIFLNHFLYLKMYAKAL